jgi:hypothetical protein
VGINWAVSALVLEALAVLVLIVAGIVLHLWRRQRRDQQAAQHLVASVQAAQVTRKDEMDKLLSEVLQLESQEKEQVLARLIEVERDFYQEFMRIYLLRDTAAVANINENVRRLTAPYHDLVRREIPKDYTHELPQEIAEEVGYDPEEHALRADLEKLQAKNATLETDLQLHQELLNRVFREYTALFGAETPGDKTLSAQEIQKRLESGTLGKPSDTKTTKEE